MQTSTITAKKSKRPLLIAQVENLDEVPELKNHINPQDLVETLVKQYLPYATNISTKVVKSLSSNLDFDEIVCNARFGLLEAARRFNSKMGVDFKTFAYYRIRGAIFDGLRKTGWLPRSLYSKIKFEQAANEYLERKYGPDAEFYEQSEMANIAETVNSVASVYVMSMESVEDLEIEDDQAKKDIEFRAEFHKIKEKVCDAVESLPEKERKLIKMYYFQNKTMEEIGEQMQLSKSWMSRLHAHSLELLFAQISQVGKDELLS